LFYYAKIKKSERGIKIMNTKVKKTKVYEGYAEQVINRLIKQDTQYRLFFNILSDKKLVIPLQQIESELRTLYHITEKSIKYLNKLLAKYKITIDVNAKVNPVTLRPIVTSDVYLPEGYRSNDKPITIYSRNHLPMVINHGN
jgi:hypothetical protein